MNKTRQDIAVDFSNVTIEDLIANPHKFGCPTLEEYRGARSKWNPNDREDGGMITLTDGPQAYRRGLKNIKFKVNGFDMKPEQVEIALSDKGFTLADIDLENRQSRLKKDIQMIPLGGGQYDVVVDFLP